MHRCAAAADADDRRRPRWGKPLSKYRMPPSLVEGEQTTPSMSLHCEPPEGG